MRHATADVRSQRLEQFVRAHRDRGLPVTRQRRAVFESVLERDDHPTADDIYAAVRRVLPEISRMTVYRILGNLVSLGLLTRTSHPGSVARFDPKLHRHHHLVCVNCGRIVDVEADQLNRVSWPDVRRFGFEIQDFHIEFRGRCATCRPTAKTRNRLVEQPSHRHRRNR